MDCNTTQEMLQLATNRLDYYILFTILSMAISTVAIIVSIRYNRKHLEHSSKLHEKQLKANHDWNRRSFTLTQISIFAKDLMSIRDELDILMDPENKVIKSNNDAYINFTDRLNHDTPLSPDEVHSWVCEHDENGKNVLSKKGKNPPCKTSKNGEKIVNKMLKFINIYEEIGIAVKNGIFDEQTIIDAFKHPVKWNYEFYKDYIKHRREDPNHKDINFGKSFEWLYEHFWRKTPESKRMNAEDKVLQN